MTSFQAAWLGSLVVLLGLGVWVGTLARRGPLGVLVDSRGRYSLTHFQVVVWTIVILSSLLGVLISHQFDPSVLTLPPTLLGLMGISAGSGVLATGVKGSKDASGSTARIARAGAFALSDTSTREVKPRFAQVWLEEEGDQADQVVSVTKYQNFIFTLVILAVYVSAALKAGALPNLPENVVWLIGISHAGYVGGKIPNKS